MRITTGVIKPRTNRTRLWVLAGTVAGLLCATGWVMATDHTGGRVASISSVAP